MAERMTSYTLAAARQRAYDGEATREDMTNLADWSWDLVEKAAAAERADRAVRRLHRPYRGVSDKDSCEHCNRFGGYEVFYPCPTIQALDGEEAARGQ